MYLIVQCIHGLSTIPRLYNVFDNTQLITRVGLVNSIMYTIIEKEIDVPTCYIYTHIHTHVRMGEQKQTLKKVMRTRCQINIELFLHSHFKTKYIYIYISFFLQLR